MINKEERIKEAIRNLKKLIRELGERNE